MNPANMFYFSSNKQSHNPTTQYTPLQTAVSPLDPELAVQHFSMISQLHGHYDEPWLHMFDFNGASRTEPMGTGNTGLDMMGTGSQVFMPSQFGSGTISPRPWANVPGTQRDSQYGGGESSDGNGSQKRS